MAGLTWTKAHIKRMAEVLDGEYETVEDAAKAAMAEAFEIVQERAKFTVVGQVMRVGNKTLAPSDEDATKFALGWYATQKQATDDALRVALSTQTHEEARAWVLPIFNGTPSAFYQARKSERNELTSQEGSYREAEIARRTKWFEDNPGAKIPDDWTVDVAGESQTQTCPTCHGIGRTPKDDVPLRADLPESQKHY
jgi:hypothetical protein